MTTPSRQATSHTVQRRISRNNCDNSSTSDNFPLDFFNLSWASSLIRGGRSSLQKLTIPLLLQQQSIAAIARANSQKKPITYVELVPHM